MNECSIMFIFGSIMTSQHIIYPLSLFNRRLVRCRFICRRCVNRALSLTCRLFSVSSQLTVYCIVLYCVFILSAISPYTTGLKALFNQSNCTGTAPTHK